MPLYDGKGVVGEKSAIVIDLGASFCKIGYTGEASPRAIIRSPDLSNLRHDMDAVHDIFAAFVHKIFFKYLIVNPKDRRVVIVEALLGETR
jgi:actin-related protein 10